MKNNKKKFSSAFLMLLVSIAMLGTSTYAWFTMSKEVSVTGMQVTATAPEDMQISLGTIYTSTGGTTASTSLQYSLSSGTGYLYESNGAAVAPREDSQWDWSNNATISTYYTFGKLMPASSTDGASIYYTPDAQGVGKTLKEDAAFYEADDDTKVTSHINQNDIENGVWEDYTNVATWDEPNDDGYYIDIPVWLRTSSTTDTDIYVTAYINKGTNDFTAADDDDDILYQAARIAILNDELESTGIITLKDNGESNTTYFSTLAETETNILDSDNYNTRQNPALTSGIYGVASNTPTWDTITINDGSTAVGILEGGIDGDYGPAARFIIRIWLEGEDGNCWNPNAGQDWTISLKFMKDPLE
jgi:hypothetical protein